MDRSISFFLHTKLRYRYSTIQPIIIITKEIHLIMMSFITIWDLIHVANRSIDATLFQTTSNEKISKVVITANVQEQGYDIRYLLLRKIEYEQVAEWWRVTNINANRPGLLRGMNLPPQPTINPIFARRTNIMEKDFELPTNETFALVYDNSYSSLNPKTIQVKIEIHPYLGDTKNLPLVNELKDKIPNEIYEELEDANACYTSGHFKQATVMLRKALDTAIMIKARQSGVQEKFYDAHGNEKTLSEKIKILLTEKLVTSRLASDIQTVKWYGDHGAHGKMKIIDADVSEIERKLRNFLSNLNLKP